MPHSLYPFIQNINFLVRKFLQFNIFFKIQKYYNYLSLIIIIIILTR